MIDPAILAADAEALRPKPTDKQLASVAELAREQQNLEAGIEIVTHVLEHLQYELIRVSEVRLPEAMAAVHMTEFALEGGYRVSVDTEYYANIPSPDSRKPGGQERRAAAFQWLKDHKHGDLIKTELTVQAGRGEQEKIANVMAALKDLKVPFNTADAVHWSTLRAFVKEQLEKGTPIPEDIFGVHVKKVATITSPKH